MKPETQQALTEINRTFYAAVTDDFDATRQHAWPGWQRVIARLPASETPLVVLDVGCGNGRFASCLEAEAPSPFEYRGIDSSAALLRRARATHGDAEHIRFESMEVARSPWPDRWPGGPFDLIGVFGLLHHIPGFETRRRILAGLVPELTPRGLLALTAWRFGASPRFENRTVPWPEYNETASRPIDIADLEPGDYLLRWKDAPEPRFCHFIDRNELRELLHDLDATLIDEFDADGRSGDLNHYAILQQD